MREKEISMGSRRRNYDVQLIVGEYVLRCKESLPGIIETCARYVK